MTRKDSMDKIQTELRDGMSFAKCKKCRCMKDALTNLKSALQSLRSEDSIELLANVEDWLNQIEETKYSCLGCEHCYPAEVSKIFNQAFPETAQVLSSTCSFEIREQIWPPVVGEYFALCDQPECAVAVSTLASVELPEALASMKPRGLCIVGKTETENIGIDKVVKNIITNPAIRFLILAGKDPKGHLSGKTLLALWKNGVDKKMRVVASPSIHPFLKNVTLEEIEAFRKQVKVINMIGCEEPRIIADRIKSLSQSLRRSSCSCKECTPEETKQVQISSAPVVEAKKESKNELDKAGYFVIIPQPQKKILAVEHYSYDNRHLRTVEGRDAESIYLTIIKNGWATQLSHAAYLGKELAKAELSLTLGFSYTQDLLERQQHPLESKAKRTKEKRIE